MTDEELDKIVEVLEDGLPDDTCRTQLGLLLVHFLKERNEELKDIIRTLAQAVDLDKLDDVTKIIALAHRP